MTTASLVDVRAVVISSLERDELRVWDLFGCPPSLVEEVGVSGAAKMRHRTCHARRFSEIGPSARAAVQAASSAVGSLSSQSPAPRARAPVFARADPRLCPAHSNE